MIRHGVNCGCCQPRKQRSWFGDLWDAVLYPDGHNPKKQPYGTGIYPCDTCGGASQTYSQWHGKYLCNSCSKWSTICNWCKYGIRAAVLFGVLVFVQWFFDLHPEPPERKPRTHYGWRYGSFR